MRSLITRILLRACTCLLFVSAPVAADQVISPITLDETLREAQSAVEQRDYDTAFALYDTAARWGHKGAQYVLGELYNEGKGVARDPIRGYAWLTVAAEAPDNAFRRARKRAGKNLSNTQKAEGERLAAELSAAYGMDAAGVICKKETRVGSNIKFANCSHRNVTANGDLIVPDAERDPQPAS